MDILLQDFIGKADKHFNPFLQSVVVMLQKNNFCSSKCRSQVQPAFSPPHFFNANHKLPILIYHSHIKSQSTLSHFPYIFPFLCSDLQPSSHCFTVHLSTSLTLTVSSHCSSSHLHPDPFSSAQTHLW